VFTLDDFDYDLPQHCIAQQPNANGADDRLMLVQKNRNAHLKFANFFDQLQPNDVVVINNSRVIKARLFAKKPTGGRVEVMIDQIISDTKAKCLLRASKSLRVGDIISIDNIPIAITAKADNLYTVESNQLAWYKLCELYGAMPLPPYIKRKANHSDEHNYQTVYAQNLGSVAAPTAGLHFQAGFRDSIKAKGAQVAEVTLYVGSGTFSPIRTKHYQQHQMHTEQYCADAANCQIINNCRKKGGRLIAVGTTSLRTIESLQTDANDNILPNSGQTQLFIYPGFQFRLVDLLLTNFHLPKSTLLLLVAAFSSRQIIMSAYAEAIAKNYRFFSYGDAMLLNRSLYQSH